MTSRFRPFEYGAVYFRKTNPPRADWARDYTTAAEDGFTSFRHWFMWAGIEIEEGRYDWDDYDAQLDLAAQRGLSTIIAEHVAIAPEWAFSRFPEARYEHADGTRIDARMQPSSSIGGAPGLCLDNDDVLERAGQFLTALAGRYRAHPGNGGYDVWNECNIDAGVCYCNATKGKFRQWLQARYGDDVRALAGAWGRYYADWADVRPPQELGAYGQSLDWLLFRRDNAHRLMRWRVDTIRAADPDSPITAHGIAGTLGWGISRGIDDWRAAAEVDSYGFTFVASRRGDEPWKQALAVELVRSASRGKAFWHAEAQAGPLWLQPQVLGRPLEDGRIATPDDIRIWNLISMAGGVTGLYYPRWRPLLDGPLFGAFGGYGMDGSRTPRSHRQSEMARWATASENADLWQSQVVTAPVSMLFVPESQAFSLLLNHSIKPYEHAITGAWRAFHDRGVLADLRQLPDLRDAKVAYLPFPMLLPQDWVQALVAWVHAGGILVCDGAPGWFGDNVHASPVQPRPELATLFGVTEESALFTPDLLRDLAFHGDGYTAFGGEVRQSFVPTTGTAVGWYPDGAVAVVDHTYGAGRTRLVGTHAGTGYYAHPEAGGFFDDTLRWAGVAPAVTVGDQRIVVRLHRGDGRTYLWLLNPAHEDVSTTVSWPEGTPPAVPIGIRWGDKDSITPVGMEALEVRIPARDGLVLDLAGAPAA